MAKIRLRRDNLAKYCKLAGITTDTELAQRMGMHQTTISRVLTGKQSPGSDFIAGLLSVFGVEFFADLFEVIDGGDS